MHSNCPQGYTKDDFIPERRIAGSQLMQETGLSLPEIQGMNLRAFKEIIDKTGNRRIVFFFPESIDDMPNCFYLKVIRKTERQSQRVDLFSKYIKIAITFCKNRIDKGHQAATKTETQEHIEILLKKYDERLGNKARLPEQAFRKIWGNVPIELKRKTGVTTQR